MNSLINHVTSETGFGSIKWYSIIPMIITRTPLRISFAGGGSDLGRIFKKMMRLFVSVTINKYVYLASHPNFNPETILIKYRKTEEAKDPRDFENILQAISFRNTARKVLKTKCLPTYRPAQD